jgi:hypothetical protein
MEPELVVALIVMVVLGFVWLLVSIVPSDRELRPRRPVNRRSDGPSLSPMRAVRAAADEVELPPGVLLRGEDVGTRCPRCSQSPAVRETQRAGWDDVCDLYWCRACGHKESGTPYVMGCGVSFWSQEETGQEAAMHRRWSASDQ